MSLFRYKGKSKIWWYEFQFKGQRVRASSKSTSKVVARDAERAHRRRIEEGYNEIKRLDRAKLFSTAAKEFLELKKPPARSENTQRIDEDLFRLHVGPAFGRFFLCDVDALLIKEHQHKRLNQGAAPASVNHEVAFIRAVLRRYGLWEQIRYDVKMLPVDDDKGRALDSAEEQALFREAKRSRSRTVYAALCLATHACMRCKEIKRLRWWQVDLKARTVTVGRKPGDSKTEAGRGRVIPLNAVAFRAMKDYAAQFPTRQADDFVFPSEHYGGSHDKFKKVKVYGTNVKKHITSRRHSRKPRNAQE
ncbi:MAG TPA: tyrosine-type recombinase/integrase [Terriglobales bacterium]|nr:tyrosine-type recombinase/integrase [Terriglobales bacterium]